MAKNKKYLSELIDLFVIGSKQGRFQRFIESDKKYEDFLDELLNDTRNLKDSVLIDIPGNRQTPNEIYSQLVDLGASDKAYVVSEDGDSDGRIGGLEDVVAAETGHSIGTLIYCVGSQVGYFEYHEGERFLLCAK